MQAKVFVIGSWPPSMEVKGRQEGGGGCTLVFKNGTVPFFNNQDKAGSKSKYKICALQVTIGG